MSLSRWKHLLRAALPRRAAGLVAGLKHVLISTRGRSTASPLSSSVANHDFNPSSIRGLESKATLVAVELEARGTTNRRAGSRVVFSAELVEKMAEELLGFDGVLSSLYASVV